MPIDKNYPAFRTIRADEIDVRIGTTKVKDGKISSITLLLYKNARFDQNVLDETVGPMNWQRHHSRDNANCTISIWDPDKEQWIEKEDTGIESYTEKEKGLASDSFKRAGFNWGIGRELYTPPFIRIASGDFTIYNGKCYDNFTVKEIKYNERREIIKLIIHNEKLKKDVFTWEAKPDTRAILPDKDAPEEPKADVHTTDKVPDPNFDPGRAISIFCRDNKINMEQFVEYRKALIEDKIVPDIPAKNLKETDMAILLAAIRGRMEQEE